MALLSIITFSSLIGYSVPSPPQLGQNSDDLTIGDGLSTSSVWGVTQNHTHLQPLPHLSSRLAPAQTGEYPRVCSHIFRSSWWYAVRTQGHNGEFPGSLSARAIHTPWPTGVNQTRYHLSTVGDQDLILGCPPNTPCPSLR